MKRPWNPLVPSASQLPRGTPSTGARPPRPPCKSLTDEKLARRPSSSCPDGRPRGAPAPPASGEGRDRLESSDGGAIPSLALAAVHRPRARDGDESRGGRPDWMAAPPLGTTPARFPTLVRSAASPAARAPQRARAATTVKVDGGQRPQRSRSTVARPPPPRVAVRPPPPRVVRRSEGKDSSCGRGGAA
nr:uncharacterized protein LOC127340177 [Lolium perenne]